MTEAADEPVQGAHDFRGRVVVVTGAASGIGLACCDELLRRGAAVVGADLNAPAFSTPSYHHLRCDLAAEADVVELFERVMAIHGRVDALINSAGILEPLQRTVDQTVADWDRVISVNARGIFLCCREAGRRMLARRSGAIVNIGSVAGLLGMPASNAYGPSKAAVAHMTRSLACEWARFSIRVNCLAPGYVDAPMSVELFSGHVDALTGALKRVPMGRLGTAEEIAQVALFLCSPVASYVTGAVIPVDGGWLAFGGPSR
ncbi:SDR family oxidoreductase [Bradyrhizobium sp. C-145]|uniref:SDR family NAD(P)-dependent oxidoreductase n=1 Tax=Bradyrhizobium sp. C-145 TaxID=574727 RepID=UPI00201B530F|nr:SDR family NAD(P)-dependent oxidoreductase [Bradyrhizobium sp. C-145]UQR61455.1 SDR family oxidoreductase [Bradyrhizobium sp. C-145]